ncbi:uncharacterized protein V6R79_026358 [Siganus canaliculatus]
MKLSVLLLLVLMSLSSGSPMDVGTNPEQIQVFMTGQWVTDQPDQVQPSSIASGDSNLKWETFKNTLPKDAVSIYNDYEKRIDYICKYKCDAGYYNPSQGPYCRYASAKKAHSGSPFEILVNRDNFETLEWKDGSYGSVPQNAVRTCRGVGIYVGKNKYGLGKVSTEGKKFYLPWRSSEYQYDSYHVLTVSTDNIISQQIDDVKYGTVAQILHFPPEIIRKTSITNYECHTVTKTDTVSKTHQVQRSWNFDFGIRIGVQTTFKVGVPFFASGEIHVSTDLIFDFSMTNTVTETITDSVNMVITAPASQSCSVRTLFYKYSVQIPFTARLSRTYSNGDVKTTYITGTYDNIHPSEIQSVVERCSPVTSNTTPCV